MATILGTHMTWISAIRAEYRSDKKPIGALVHSIQAVSVPILFDLLTLYIWWVGQARYLLVANRRTEEAEEAAQ
jgi:hypothetical protein